MRSKLAAVISIQAAWRAHLRRRPLALADAALRRRAAICVQRAWRSALFQQHMHALGAAALLARYNAELEFVPGLCLTLRGARMIALAQGRGCDAMPGNRLRWSLLQASGGAPRRPATNCDFPCVEGLSARFCVRSVSHTRFAAGQRAYDPML